MVSIKARDFSSREELENHVRGLRGLTVDIKDDIEIKGTRAELVRIGLSDRTLFWGIRCMITDTPSEPKKQAGDKPARGEIKGFGLNGAVAEPGIIK